MEKGCHPQVLGDRWTGYLLPDVALPVPSAACAICVPKPPGCLFCLKMHCSGRASLVVLMLSDLGICLLSGIMYLIWQEAASVGCSHILIFQFIKCVILPTPGLDIPPVMRHLKMCVFLVLLWHGALFHHKSLNCPLMQLHVCSLQYIQLTKYSCLHLYIKEIKYNFYIAR